MIRFTSIILGAALAFPLAAGQKSSSAEEREAIRFERAKIAAAERQARKEPAEVKSAGSAVGEESLSEAIRFEKMKVAAGEAQARRDERAERASLGGARTRHMPESASRVHRDSK